MRWAHWVIMRSMGDSGAGGAKLSDVSSGGGTEGEDALRSAGGTPALLLQSHSGSALGRSASRCSCRKKKVLRYYLNRDQLRIAARRLDGLECVFGGESAHH
jgi:hypothetical protein